MLSNHKSVQSVKRLVILFSVILLLSVTAAAQTHRLVLRVGEVLAPSASEGIPIPVYMENYFDTVAAFEYWMLLSNPDVFEFQNSPLKASEVNFDTTNTLISGWEFVTARSIAGTGMDAKITGQANTYLPPYTNGIGYPQYGDIPLIKILADIYELPENPFTVTTGITINTDMVDNFSFSDENGASIGIITDTIIDTTCWMCTQWQDPPENTICLHWELISGTTGDSCAYDTTFYYRIDTSQVEVIDGSLTTFLCGDINGDYKVNIFDITELIGILYIDIIPPPHWDTIGDVNKDGAINIFDITSLIAFLYLDGPAPMCDYEWL